jgi:EAL and modified HD-GYP domain-containing signal transduction protein
LTQVRQTDRDPSTTHETKPVAVPTRFLGRQPILDSSLNLYGYELLFRAGTLNAFSGDGEEATRQVIDNCLMLMPETGQGKSFVNCTRDALVSGIVTLLPPTTTVLEILEDISPDPELIQACCTLKKAGYHFALDDFAPDDAKRPFLDFADYIKVDFLASDPAERKLVYAMAATVGAKIIAEKVETAKDMQEARAEGCDLFQGYFFCKPFVVSTRIIPQNRLIYLRILAALGRVPADISEIEQLVMSDASICYRLLRLVNSALFAQPTPVTSVRSALLLVGDDEFRKVVTVAIANAFTTTGSKAVVQLALERAKFCELLAPLLRQSPSKLYLLGMLSLIDVILELPMSQILRTLPLDHEMKAALLGRESALTTALDLVRCHESGNWEKYKEVEQKYGLSEIVATSIYLESVHWADTINRT